MLKNFLVVLALVTTPVYAQTEAPAYAQELMKGKSPGLIKLIFGGKKNKKEKKEKAKEEKPGVKVQAKTADPREQKLKELQEKERAISDAANKQLVDHIAKLGPNPNIVGDPEYFKLFSEVKKKERDEIAKLYEGVWTPEEQKEHQLAFTRDVCRADRTVYLLGQVKPELIEKIMLTHEGDYDKQEAIRLAEQAEIEKKREQVAFQPGFPQKGNWKYNPMVEDGMPFEDPMITYPDARPSCEAMMEQDKKLYQKEVVVVEKVIKPEAQKVDQKLKNLNVETCSWVADMPRRKVFGPGCSQNSKKFICVGYVSCEQKSTKVRTIRASTCSENFCGDNDATACTAELGYGSVDPKPEEKTVQNPEVKGANGAAQ